MLTSAEKGAAVTQQPHDRHAGKDRCVHCVAFSIACVVLWAIFANQGAWAQYRSTQWTVDSGLPQNDVRGIVHSPDGYLWIATLDGIAKFDGIRFTVFNKSNTPGITSNRFVAMVSGVDSDLWMTSEDDNLIRYHAGHFEPIGESAGLRPYSVSAISTDHHGSIWVDSDDKVYRWSPQTGHFEKEAFRPRRHAFHSFVVGRHRILGDPGWQSSIFHTRSFECPSIAENIDVGIDSRRGGGWR